MTAGNGGRGSGSAGKPGQGTRPGSIPVENPMKFLRFSPPFVLAFLFFSPVQKGEGLEGEEGSPSNFLVVGSTRVDKHGQRACSGA